MELWGWLVAYLVLFALLHLVLYVFYANRESDERGRESDDRTPAPSLTDGSRTGTPYSSSPDGYPTPDDVDHDVDGESIQCPHCGAPNDADQTFTYCWNCISTLR